MNICQNCGHENSDSGKFCEECGSKLIEVPKFCPECGAKLEGIPKFCTECGFNLFTYSSVCNESDTDDYKEISYESDNEDENTYSYEEENASYSDESDGYEEYVNENEYVEEETKEEKIRKIVDKYIDKISKDCFWYSSAGCADSEYFQVFQNVRSKIAKDARQSEIIGFIDTTIIGKGKAGLVFTTSALYEKGSVSGFKIPYHRMGRMKSNGKQITFGGTEDCGTGLAKGRDCEVYNSFYNIPALKDCLDEIYAII
ncbi:MAG: zinc ribbon domain-containing protein [Spirochaetia bacterium]|nr:zinc ribbon domain-containing protein [Spirochaetia bacterium]MDD7609524.1 zinc ribbon domain-containing protein [Spirochaetales bacterium]MDY5913837.1 zinc ribbon domain-containing protein [Treponema sp.]